VSFKRNVKSYSLLALTAFPVNVIATQHFLTIITEIPFQTDVRYLLLVCHKNHYLNSILNNLMKDDIWHVTVCDGINSRNTFKVKVLKIFKVRCVCLKDMIFSWCTDRCFLRKEYRICTERIGCEKIRIRSHLARLSKATKTRFRKVGIKGVE
jgi:IS1 family transposase